MSSPEDIPEDREQSYPCPECKDGEITLHNNVWGCSCCGFAKQAGDGTT